MAELAIIIPAYNASKTIGRTVASIQQSTLSDIEIWVVDDGSTDDTLAVVEAFAKEDSRIHVLHQENKGCYMARLCALRKIVTPYFAFVDADDTVKPEMYERLLKIMKDMNLDIVECDAVGAGRNDGAIDVLEDGTSVYEKCIYPRLIQGYGAVFVWDKIYRNKFDFTEFAEVPVLMFEDMVFNLQFFKECNRFAHLHQDLYYYDVNTGSSVRNYRPKNLYDLVTTIKYRRSVAHWFGLEKDALVFDLWTIRNARNVFISASNAPVASWSVRIENIKQIAKCEEIICTCERLRACGKNNGDLQIVGMFIRTPRVVCILFHFLKKVQRLMHM